MIADHDWLIIGGGLQGRFVARSIAQAAPEATLTLADPQPALANWHRCTHACGMRYLRSSSAHHLGQPANDLRRFARQQDYDASHWLGRYRRPSLALFNAHAEQALQPVPPVMPHTVQRLERAGSVWQATLDNGQTHTARRVVLATGPGRPRRPPGLAEAEHVFDAHFRLGAPGPATLIIGGGISAAQLALRAVNEGHRIAWLTRHQPAIAAFDSDPCYAGPRCLEPLSRLPMAERTQPVNEARHPGTLTPELHQRMIMALSEQRLAWCRGQPLSLDEAGVHLADGRHLAADRVILATGFDPYPVADSLLGRVIRDLALTRDRAGHLYADETLAVAPGLHIIGRPASLRLGPMAGNIKGARLAGQRLAALARRGQGKNAPCHDTHTPSRATRS